MPRTEVLREQLPAISVSYQHGCPSAGTSRVAPVNPSGPLEVKQLHGEIRYGIFRDEDQINVGVHPLGSPGVRTDESDS